MRRVDLAAAAAVLVLLLPITVSAKTAAAAAPAKAPVAAPPAPPNITAAMEKGGCKAFAALLSASPDASSTFQSAIDGGVTAFCPSDGAVKSFLPRYKNLTAAGKASLLLSHAVPVYYTRRALKSNNGVMSTLATDGGAGNFNLTVQNVGDQVSVKTGAAKGKGKSAARVESTVYDKEPVAVYAVDAVLEPVELFKPAEAEAPAPAPAPAPAAHKKAASKKARHRDDDDVADAPSPDADDEDDDEPPADQMKSSKNGAARPGGHCLRWLAVVGVGVAAVLA